MKKTLIRLLIVLICAATLCVSLTFSSNAYDIVANGGYDAPSLHFYAWSGFSEATLEQFDKAFDEWNYKAYSAKPSSLWIDRSGKLTDQTESGCPNGINEIAKGNRGTTNSYLMLATLTLCINYSTGTTTIIEADIDVNGSFPWANSVLKNYYFVQNAFTHEVGHVYGLGDLDDSEYSESTMYYSASKNEDKKCTIEADDIAGIKAIYGGN